MSYHVVSYITDKLNEEFPDKIDLYGITHINYGFVFLRDDTLYIRRPDCLKKMRQICTEQKVKLLVSLQQWGGQKFDERSRTEEWRRKNAAMVREIVDEYELDGVDVDWEYPGLNLRIDQPIEDFNDDYYILFMQALRDVLPDKLLTIAHGGENRHWIHTDFTRLAPILDFINLMGYDFNWSSLGSSHHSNLYPASVGEVQSELCDDRAIRYYLSQGVPSYKINIGVPYYGYVAKQGPEGFYRFDQIEHLLRTDPHYERQFDEKAKQSYVTKDGVFHIAYDDERTLVEKCRYIKENHLGGLMDWTYNHDPEGQARRIVARELLEDKE
ncbi:MAG: hypothetical protein IKG51_03800 [Firmicutes bacterium]|nr:hypothetical protein [Bacillota bacterium]